MKNLHGAAPLFFPPPFEISGILPGPCPVFTGPAFLFPILEGSDFGIVVRADQTDSLRITPMNLHCQGASVPLSDPSPHGESFHPGSEEDLLKSFAEKDEEVIASFFTSVPKMEPLVPLSLDPGEPRMLSEKVVEHQQFWIRVADTKERREQAGLLIDRMYAWRGYTHNNIIRETPHSITLVSYGRDGRVIGTVTINMDVPGEKLLSEETYPDQIAHLRDQGKRIAEFNGLAVDSSVKSKLVIARLFHIAMLYPWGLYGYTDCVIEVSSSHARFYERLLEFDRIGEGKICPRVNNESILMHKDFSEAAARVAQVGGEMERSGDRSLYSYGFSPQDAAGILGRLKRMQHHSETSG